VIDHLGEAGAHGLRDIVLSCPIRVCYPRLFSLEMNELKLRHRLVKEHGKIEVAKLRLLVLLDYLQKCGDVAVRLRMYIKWVSMPACNPSEDTSVATEASLERSEAIIEPTVLSLAEGIFATLVSPLLSRLQLLEKYLGLLGEYLHDLLERLRHVMPEIVDALPRLATLQDDLLD
jgi:hypothetical protein